MARKFDWDKGNETKSVTKHGISNEEAESVFNDPRRIVYFDKNHSAVEKRYICIAKSGTLTRILFSYFTYRGRKTHIIGTRPANKTEIEAYEKR